MPRRELTPALRSIRRGLTQRRENRRQRSQRFWLASGISLLVLILLLPTLVSHSPLIHWILRTQGEKVGWKVDADSIGIGWITPLRIEGLEAVGPSGKTRLTAQSLDGPLTILGLLAADDDLGTWNLDSARLETSIYLGNSRLEEDLEPLLESPDEPTAIRAQVVVRNATTKWIAEDSGRAWRADQVQIDLQVDPQRITVQCEGLLTDPDSISGTFQGKCEIATDASAPVDAQITSRGLPLSPLELIALRLPETARSLPERWSGNVTGTCDVSLRDLSRVHVRAQPLDLRNLVVIDRRFSGNQPWKLSQAWLEGMALWEGGLLECRQVRLQTDAGSMEMNGTLDPKALLRGDLLAGVQGSFTTDLDLAALSRATPGLIPLKDDVAIERGRLQAEAMGGFGSDQQFRSRLQLTSEPLVATIAGSRTITIQPITADVVLRPTDRWVTAEQVQIHSSFGHATARGDLQSGGMEFQVDLNQLDAMLRNLVQMPDVSIAGTASGNLQWSLGENNRWSFRGVATARDLLVPVGNGGVLQRSKLDIQGEGEGIFGERALVELTQLEVQLNEQGQGWQVVLTSPVQNPLVTTRFPLHIRGQGELATIAQWVEVWEPALIDTASGTVEGELHGLFGKEGFSLTGLDFTGQDVALMVAGQPLSQAVVEGQFAGLFAWPEGILQADRCTLSSSALSFAAQGAMDRTSANLEVAYRADLQQLGRALASVPQPSQRDPRSLSMGVSQGSPLLQGWELRGAIEGTSQIQRAGSAAWRVVMATLLRDFQAIQPGTISRLAPGSSPLAPTPTILPPQVLWDEPALNLAGEIVIAAEGYEYQIPSLQIASQWLDSQLTGMVTVNELGHQLVMQGPATIKMDVASQRITKLLGEPILARGKHATTLNLLVRGRKDQPENIELVGTVGWDAVEMTGVKIGPATVPLRVTQDTAFIDHATLPLERGQIHVHGAVHFRPGDLWFEQQPGLFAEGVALTPEMCRSWLKYMLPLAADTAEVGGTFSAELDRCLVYPSDPIRSRVEGTLQVESAMIGPGPMARNLLAAVDQIALLTKGQPPAAASSQTGGNWLVLNPQAIDFALVQGSVWHQRMMANVGNVSLISSGSVGLDGRINLGIQVPLNAAWLGADLQGLAGKTVLLPLVGTLTQPSIDPQAFSRTVAELGAQGLQSTAENFLQKQLDRQLEKLFGK